MGSGVPLLNEYKQEFLWKRLPQTILGGAKLRIGYDAPFYIYLTQVLLLLIPVLFNAVLTPLVTYGIMRYDIGIYAISGLTFIYVLIVNALSAHKKRTQAAVSTMARNTQNVLAEEDEIEFTSCCGVDSVTFVTPGKKFSINIILHAIFSAAHVGVGFWYLLPSTLNSLFGENLGSTLTLHLLGWLTILIAQYSLTVAAPAEPATYNADDTYELTPLMRPFYCCLCFTIDLLARFYSSDLVVTNQVGHIVFVTLPLLWTLGLLSPLTAFFMWLIEQAIIFVFGGSAMASDLRSIIMLLVSLGCFFLVYFIPRGIATNVIMATFGYLLAIDLGSLINQSAKRLCWPHRKPEANEVSMGEKFLWRWSLPEALFHLLMLILTGTTAALLNLFVAPSSASYSDYLLYVVMGLFVIDHILSDIQSVYVLLGLWRNRLFPSSTQRTTLYHKAKTRLKPLGYLRRILKNFVAPLVILSWLSMAFTFTDGSSSSSSSALNITNTTIDLTAGQVLGLHRAYRWLWQNTLACMVDVTIYQLVRLAFPTSTLGWMSLPAGLQLLLVSLIRDRVFQLLHKLYLYVMLVLTSWTDKKQRRRSTFPIMLLNILLFPLVLAVIASASALSAPLLPLFTLPVFFIAYPRPRRSWPGSVGVSANICADTVYYRHLAPELARALSTATANGSMGDAAVGNHYLVRYQDRLAWIQILERGYLYLTVSIKGLELQETSCHTMEAQRIDDLFEATFEIENPSCCVFNPHPLNVLQPRDSAHVKTYSDARNQLTGVIDSPDSLRLIADGFVQALVWILLHHCRERKRRGEIYLAPQRSKSGKTTLGHGRTSSGQWKKLRDDTTITNSTKHVAPSASTHQASLGLGDEWQWEADAPSGGAVNNTHQQRPLSGRSRPMSAHSGRKTSNSLRSLNDSWASDNESLILEEFDSTARKRPNLVALTAMREQMGPGAVVRDEPDYLNNPPTKPRSGILPPLREDQQRHVRIPGLLSDNTQTMGGMTADSTNDSMDDFLNDMEFGLPAADINQLRRQQGPESHISFKSQVTAKSDPRTPGQIQLTSLSESLHFSTLNSRMISPPLHWRDSPVERRQLTPLLDKFPKAWYRYVIGVMDFTEEKVEGEPDVAAEIAKDSALEDVYMKLVMSCYAIVNVLGSGITDVVSLGPTHVHKVYAADIPWSLALSWLQEDDELHDLVIKAFRYGVKLAVDQVVLGEVSSMEELQSYMEEYESDYYIGLETDPGWTDAILKSTPNLFSLNYIPTQGTFSSRVLTLSDMPMYIGSVSAEAVRGQWANLTLELLYMTNDDEERNSIQAHPTLLRNLTVQAADPPLGYPVYASTPVSLPTL